MHYLGFKESMLSEFAKKKNFSEVLQVIVKAHAQNKDIIQKMQALFTKVTREEPKSLVNHSKPHTGMLI